jgi:hypothetical protein
MLKFLSSCTTRGFSRRAQLHEVSKFVSTRFDHHSHFSVARKKSSKEEWMTVRKNNVGSEYEKEITIIIC